ncbi:MAG: RHS repeat-associated core domain-containing protein [Paracoccaceae bacterium]
MSSASRQNDANATSGVHQNWMRDYDPTTGRYIQADPPGLVDGASVYGYARQNSGRYVDPRGEQAAPRLDTGKPKALVKKVGSDLI